MLVSARLTITITSYHKENFIVFVRILFDKNLRDCNMMGLTGKQVAGQKGPFLKKSKLNLIEITRNKKLKNQSFKQ